jgi:hypothetical protein
MKITSGGASHWTARRIDGVADREIQSERCGGFPARREMRLAWFLVDGPSEASYPIRVESGPPLSRAGDGPATASLQAGGKHCSGCRSGPAQGIVGVVGLGMLAAFRDASITGGRRISMPSPGAEKSATETVVYHHHGRPAAKNTGHVERTDETADSSSCQLFVSCCRGADQPRLALAR